MLSLIQVESSFHVKAVSPVGAVGLMQVMPKTADVMVNNWGLPAPAGNTSIARALTDPFFNITMGVALPFYSCASVTKGKSPYYLLAAYNVGPARFEDLLARHAFRPDKTAKYYDAIRRGITGFRYYRHPEPRRKLLANRRRRVVNVRSNLKASSL